MLLITTSCVCCNLFLQLNIPFKYSNKTQPSRNPTHTDGLFCVCVCVWEIFLLLRIFQFLILSFSHSLLIWFSGSSSVPNLQEAVPWASANAHAIWWYSGAAHPVVMARQHTYRRERKKGRKWEYSLTFDILFFVNIDLKMQWKRK